MVVLCRARNDVMDSPVEALAQLEVLCTYGIILLYCYFKLQLYTLHYVRMIKKMQVIVVFIKCKRKVHIYKTILFSP